MDFKSILLAQKTGYIPRNHFDALFARRIGGAVLKDFPGLPASIVTVTDAVAKPLDGLKVAITPVQSGSGDPSPDNIRPISGWTECNVYETNKNMFSPLSILQGTYDSTTNVWTINIPSASDVLKFDFKPNTQYTFSGKAKQNSKNRNMRFVVFYTDGSYDALWASNLTDEITFAVTSDKDKTISSVQARYSSYGGSLTITNFQIEVGTSASQYVAPNGTTYTITFPSEAGTVYGGTLDVVNGTLTVDRRYVDLGDFTWTQNMAHQFYSNILDIAGVSNRFGWSIICSAYKRGEAYDHINDKTICLYGSGNGRIWIYDIDLRGTATEVKEALTGYKCVYELTTPITYQLTPTEITMLLGTNNLWADTGDILEGKYYAKK